MYERTGWQTKRDEYGRPIPREEPIFCLKTSDIDNGCPNQFRPDSLEPVDEQFLGTYALCKEFGWSIQQALTAPNWFVPRFFEYSKLKNEYEKQELDRIKSKSHGS